MPYIYKITNDINNKIYIGKTSNSIEKRFQQHLLDAIKLHREKRPLYDAINKYGKEHFNIELIEEVINEDIAIEREKYWIKQLNTYIGFKNSNGYNATLGGDGKRFYNYSFLANEYISLGSIRKVCQKYNCDHKTVQLACKEKNIQINRNIIKRKVRRIDKINNYKDYQSVYDAAKEFTNKPIENVRKNIQQALKKNQTAYGYKWIYLD